MLTLTKSQHKHTASGSSVHFGSVSNAVSRLRGCRQSATRGVGLNNGTDGNGGEKHFQKEGGEWYQFTSQKRVL